MSIVRPLPSMSTRTHFRLSEEAGKELRYRKTHGGCSREERPVEGTGCGYDVCAKFKVLFKVRLKRCGDYAVSRPTDDRTDFIS